jgi:hypothetical protein
MLTLMGVEVGSPHHAASRFDLISMTLTGVGGPAVPQHAASWFESISDLNWFLATFGVIATLFVTQLVISSRTRRSLLEVSGNDRREPPRLAESLLYVFARTKDIEALRGDFEEYFERDCASGMSEGRAGALYWARVLRSLWPQIGQWINRVGWAGLIAAVLKR